MPATYSIQVGTIIEAFRKPDIFSVLQDLPDNTQKLITPRDVRDAFLSTWANSSFKLTNAGTSTNEYIGIDSSNPENRDIKNRILIGKRSFGNLDIMNNTLLNNSNADIFIYNTKPDSSDQSSTKVAFLAGTNSTLNINAPYIESIATASVINMEIINPSPFGGAVNIASTAGRVAINGIIFPTIADTVANASNGRVLKYSGTYPNGSLTWADPILTLTDIGSPNSPTNLFGSPSVYVNGYPLEFIDDNLVPQQIGGIPQGFSFSENSFITGSGSQNWPIVEVLREILYPQIDPVLELSVFNTATGTKYAERGVTSTFSISYNITTYARDNSEDIRDIIISASGQSYPNYTLIDTISGLPFSANPGSATSSNLIFVTSSNTNITIQLGLALQSTSILITNLFDLQSGYPANYSSVTQSVIEFITPVFCGFSSTLITDSTTLQTVSNNLDKIFEPYPGVSGSIVHGTNGTGYLYFLFPNSFGAGLGEPQLIKDPNGFVIYDSSLPSIYSTFTSSVSTISHPVYSEPYEVWRTILTTSYTGTGEFEFIF
jgi:hypothetical protein